MTSASPKLPFLIAFCMLLTGAETPAAQRYQILSREKVILEIRPLTATPVKGGAEPRRLDLDPDGRATLELALLWPDAESRCDIRLEARDRSGGPGAPHLVELVTETRLADGTTTRRERRISVSESSTVLFEVARVGDQVLTLGIETEIVTEPFLRGRPVAGAPVQLQLEIQRVEEGRSITLETNRLNTLVGEPVAYSFRLGNSDDAPAVRVQMKPLDLSGQVLKLEVEISGTLPVGETTEVAGRREEWLASRGTTSSFAFVSGEPPTGYRFLITPFF